MVRDSESATFITLACSAFKFDAMTATAYHHDRNSLSPWPQLAIITTATAYYHDRNSLSSWPQQLITMNATAWQQQDMTIRPQCAAML
jgi:hypothetical protein